MPNGDSNSHHISPTLSTLIGLGAAVVALVAFIQGQPTQRELEQIRKEIDSHHALTGHPGVVAQVASTRSELASIDKEIENVNRRINELKFFADDMKDRQISNQEREARMDEALRQLDSSVPSIVSRLSTLEADVKALMKLQDVLQKQK